MPTPNPRQSGFPGRDAPESVRYEMQVRPTSGFTTVPAVLAPPSSIVSGQNVWLSNGELQNRYRLSRDSISVLAGVVNDTGVGPVDSTTTCVIGTVVYYEVSSLRSQAAYPVVVINEPVSPGKQTLQYAKGDLDGSLDFSWSIMSYVSSGGSSLLPSANTSNRAFGCVSYSASRNSNLLIVSGFTTAGLYCWPGFNAATAQFSLLTGAPAAADVINFDNRPVAWNCYYVSGLHVPQRVQWPVAGEPEDWTGIGSGTEDLVDMNGAGTRIFAQSDQMILATDSEIWRGRAVGLPYVFQFSPIHRQQGMPFARAATHTPEGIFFLDNDRMVWRMVNEQLEAVGSHIQRELLDTLSAPEFAFFSYHGGLRHVRLFYSTSTSQWPTRSYTFDIAAGAWTKETYGHQLEHALNLSVPSTLVGDQFMGGV